MRIKLIYPKTEYVSVSTKAKQYLVPPQGLLALASVTPRTHELEMNPFWPLLARLGLASAPFRAFVKAAVRHHRTRLWNAAEACIEPATAGER